MGSIGTENVKRGWRLYWQLYWEEWLLPGFPVFPAKAAPASGQQTTLTTAHGDTLLGHKLYCIDKGGYAIWGIAGKKGISMKHTVLPGIRSAGAVRNRNMYFGRCSRLGGSAGDEKANTFIRAINVGSKSTGKTGNYQDGVRGRSEKQSSMFQLCGQNIRGWRQLRQIVRRTCKWEECCLAEATERKIPVSAAERFQM